MMRVLLAFACMVSFVAFLRGEPCGKKKSAKLHVKQGVKLDNQIEQAELIVETLKREVGCEKIQELLLYMGTKGSQPSDGDVQVLSSSDEDAAPRVRCACSCKVEMEDEELEKWRRPLSTHLGQWTCL